MKIVDLKTAVVTTTKATLVRIDTEEALSGFGEANPDSGAAAVYYLPFAPHLVSTPLGTVTTRHVCAAVPNFPVLE
jgi:L-alanine-DL-glutamate epimerase-like enolase superfamily enzyme